MTRRRRLLLISAAAAAAVAVIVGTVVLWPRGADEAAPSSELSTAPDATPMTAVCGFDGPLVGAITAVRPSGDDEALPEGRRVADAQSNPIGMWASDAGVSILWSEDDGFEVSRYDSDGAHKGDVVARLDMGTDDYHGNGSIGMADDGTMYVIDSYQGRRALVRFAPDGSRVWSKDVPASDETTDDPHDLTGATWVPDRGGRPAILITEGTHTVHVFREDGSYDGAEDSPLVGVTSVERSTIFGPASGADDASYVLRGWDEASDSAVLGAAVATPSDDAAPLTPAPDGLADVTTGPGGEGFLLLDARGVEWIDANGIRAGLWPYAGDRTTYRLTHRDGRYWMLSDVDDGQNLISVTDGDMRALLTEPTNVNAGNEPDLAILGIGIGATTDATLGHFDAGEKPQVALHAEPGWGELTANLSSEYEVRYTVTGDPRLATAPPSTSGSLPLPIGGGDTPLELPETQPGAYLASLTIVRLADDTPVSGQCLHYSVGAPGADLDLDALADGADWGGAASLRGVELADELGIGSHRVQLDFGALIADPQANPSEDGVDWMALPGADRPDDGSDPAEPVAAGFADLRRAAAYAGQHDVDLIVQVGQGGDAELQAVQSGTWQSWVEVIVAGFAKNAPGITLWEPWNEPNNNVAGGAGDYTTEIDLPFREGARAADPRAEIISGNTLGFDEDWWKDAVAAGICTGADAIGVHPYTGWNRSWEEEGWAVPGAGYDSLRTAVGSPCTGIPIWDTETGWTADGAAAYWAQGSNVARKLLWYSADDIAGWTYFYSEGGWGENNLSWSLIQVDQYVKPGALAFASVSRLIDGRTGTPLQTGIPNSYAMSYEGDDALVAAWTDDQRVDAVVTSDADHLEVVDQYGATRELSLSGGSATLSLSGAPVFVRAPSGSRITLSSAEPYGDDVLAGRPVTATSTHEDSSPDIVTSGTVNPYQPWRSGRLESGDIDESPSVGISLAAPTVIDRIAVASGSMVCCQTGLRDYTVQVQDAAGDWQTVAEQHDQFSDRVAIFSFTPVEATAVRVQVPWTTIRGTKVLDVNYSGFAGGLPPPFMGLQTESDYVVSIAAIQAWAAP